MDIQITKQYVESLKSNQATGQSRILLSELKKIYGFLGKGSALVICLSSKYYVMFDEIPGLEFVVTDCKKQEDLNFIKNQDFIDASAGQVSYLNFITNELIQGKGYKRIVRLVQALLPLALLNFVIFSYASTQSIKDTFTGLLAAISIFIAVFSLFTISQEYLKRKQLRLFKSGKLAYYFSIDRHMITTGLIGIYCSILGILITPTNNIQMSQKVVRGNIQQTLEVLLLNLAFFTVFIVLRSLKEFYIKRPGAYIMGDLKKEAFVEREETGK